MAKLTQKYLESILPHQAGEKVRDEGNLFGRVRVKANGRLTIPNRAEHESSRKLLGQFTGGKAVQESEIGMGAECGLHDGAASTSGHQPLPDAPV
jgi:hypothetical protein